MPGGPEYPVLGGVENKKGAGVGQGAPFSQSFPHSTQGGVLTTVFVPFLGPHTTLYTPVLELDVITVPFLSSHTTVFAPLVQPGTQARLSQIVAETLVSGGANARLSQIVVEALRTTTTGTNAGVSQLVVEVLVQHRELFVPFLGPHTTVYPPTLEGVVVHVPFLASRTHVWRIMSLFDPNRIYSGGGNGGAVFTVRLAPNGSSETATLNVNISASANSLTVDDGSVFPLANAFMVTIDSEVLYLIRNGVNTYRIHGRGLSNTTPASHSAGATVTWNDTYDEALVVTDPIAGNFTANIHGSGSTVYPGWLVVFDSSQGYLAGDRYPMHVDQLLGVFAAGAGSGGSNKTDGAQPSASASPNGVSDDCPVGITNPARIQTDINTGDVALVRYVNPEGSELDLGPRSVAIQSWFGLKRVSTSDADVTLTNPNGIVVDTTGTYDTFTGAVNEEFANPLPLATGIAPDASDATSSEVPTPQTVPWMTTTLPGTDRFFTFGPPDYSEKGWPFGVLAVRQGNRRVPFWQSWDWHDFSFVYDGFGTDCTFAQIVVNRNGITDASVPSVVLPGPQDIDGPDVVWDDATYAYATSWYVAIYGTPYLLAGPVISGAGPSDGGVGSPVLIVDFPGGTGGGPGPPSVTTPPPVEGGSGGDIGGESVGMHIWHRSGGF